MAPSGARPAEPKGVADMFHRLLGRGMRGAVRAYQLVLSPLLGPRCRHLPTCSDYALQAIAVHGPWRGAWLSAGRILRCHPLGTSGYDPVPEKLHGPSTAD